MNLRKVAIVAASVGLAVTVGGLVATQSVSAVANAYAYVNRPAPVSTTVYVPVAYDYYVLPACDEDAPDPSMTEPCVWEDEGLYWVMDGRGNADTFEPCATEDSDECVWDSATRGNMSADVDSPTRFGVSAARGAHPELYPNAIPQ